MVAVLVVSLFAMLWVGCDEGVEGPRDLQRIATLNAGTTPFLDLLGESVHRPTCETYYDNNLCLTTSEEQVAAALRADRPDLVFLQEMWPQSRCAEADRPRTVNEAPYACSAGMEPQLERVLPTGYAYACGAEYPDNCIAFRTRVWSPLTPAGERATCQGRDCSAHLVEVSATCGRQGRVAWLPGELLADGGRALAVVVHLNAGIEDSDRQCRAEQLAAIGEILADEPVTTRILMGGDFNFDPTEEGRVDAQALSALMAEVGLERLSDDGDTHRMFASDFDLVLTRGWGPNPQASCRVRVLDEGSEAPMFDHAFVSCW